MSEQTTSSIVMEATPAEVMAAIADFESYPLWAKGVSKTEIVEPGADGLARVVRFNLDVPPVRDEYELAYTWQSPHRVSWTLVRANLLKALDGSYEIVDLGNGTCQVTYTLTLDLLIPFIGMLKRKGEKLIIDAALSGLRARVESIAGR